MAQTNQAQSLVRWLWLPVLFAFLWAGWVLWSRRASIAAAEQAASQKEASQDRDTVERLGGDTLKILSFYANPGAIKTGGKALLCYGVSNAKTVEITPDVPPVAPSLSRCLEIRPKANTTYTIKAKDEKGGEVTESVPVRVM